MTWLDLDVGILEEFSGIQSAYVNATARQAEWYSRQAARVMTYREKWRAANPEKHRVSAAAWARRHYAANREKYREKNRQAYERRKAA